MRILSQIAIGVRGLGDRARDNKYWWPAVLLYQASLRIESNSAPVWVQLGHVLKENGQLRRAEGAYREATRIDSTSVDAFFQLGQLQGLQGENHAARASYETALSLSQTLANGEREPAHPDIHVALGNLARDEGQWQLASACYREAIRGNAKDVPILIQLGHALKEAGDRASAEHAYRSAIGLNPNSADAQLHLGHLLRIQSRHREALRSYVTALRLQSDLEDARQALLVAVGYSPSEFERYTTSEGEPTDLKGTFELEEHDNGFSSDLGQAAQVEGPAIIWLSNVEWHFRRQRPQHLATALAEAGARVIYISLTFEEGGSEFAFRTIGRPHQRVREIRVGFPDGEFACVANGLSATQGTSISMAIQRAMRAYGITRAIVLVEDPNWGPVAASLASDLIVYDCVDDLSGFSDTKPSRLSAELCLLQKADLVVVTSTVLADRLASFRPRIVRNGVDVNQFKPAPIPRRNQARPILGYYGALREWLAIDWIVYCARRHPDWTFWLIGRKELGFQEASDLPNVKFLGEQPYDKLPEYLAQFDVALIPFIKNDLTVATNPVKLYEYLATGKPVVTTDLPEIEAVANLVYMASDERSFEAAIEAALHERRHDFSARRAAWATNHSWTVRAHQLLEAIGVVEQ